MIFSKNKVYDILKFISMVVIPAVAALYLGLANLWNWDHTTEVVGSLALFSTFLGTLLQLSAVKYNNSDASTDGYLGATGVDPDTGNPDLGLTLTEHPKVLMKKKTVRLRVGTPPPAPEPEELDHG